MFYNPGTKVIDEKGTFKLPPQKKIKIKKPEDKFKGKLRIFMNIVRHVTGNDEDYLRKIPRVVVQKSALL